MADKLPIDGVVIPTEAGFSREAVAIPDGEYSIDEILAFLIDRWISIYECEKCSRFSYCKFSQKNSTRISIQWGQQCGVVVSALDNVLQLNWEDLVKASPEQIEEFLTALYHLVKFVWDVEVTIGVLADVDSPKIWGENIVRWQVAHLTNLRYELDSLAFRLPNFHFDAPLSLWILVEGDSEAEFLQRLIDHRFFPTSIYGVDSYDGKTNATETRLRQLIDNLTKRGYHVLLQGDADRSHTNRFDSIVQAGLVSSDNIFRFSRDFESSFPAIWLERAFKRLGYGLDLDWLNTILSNRNASLVRAVEQKTGRSVDKIELAFALGDLARWYLIRHSDQRDYEIVQWMEFIRSHAYPRIG